MPSETGKLFRIIVALVALVRFVIIKIMFIFHVFNYFFFLFTIIITHITCEYLPKPVTSSSHVFTDSETTNLHTNFHKIFLVLVFYEVEAFN